MIQGTPLLQAIDVRKSYGTVVALHGASISAEAGKVNCLLGDNGAGKSTFIKILSGVEAPDAGTVLMNGEPVIFSNPKAALDRGIATVFQDLRWFRSCRYSAISSWVTNRPRDMAYFVALIPSVRSR